MSDREVMSGSRMTKKCQECKRKDDCQNKRLEAFSYMKPIGEVTSRVESPNGITFNVNINPDIDIIKEINNNVINKMIREGKGLLRL